MDREQALELQRTGLREWIEAMAASSPGARLFQRDGVTAVAAPACPERGIVNSVSFTDPGALLALLGEVAAFQHDSGVDAWEVWVEDYDTETIIALEGRGLEFDGEPQAMTLDLASWQPPEAGDLEWDHDVAPATLGRLNDLAYGLDPEFGIARGMSEPAAAMRLFQAHEDGGEPACVLATIDHTGDDLGVYFVATHPAHRGRGLASRLTAVALAEGKERGMQTSSLQASAMGKPIYAGLGYESHFQMNMYEHRLPAR